MPLPTACPRCDPNFRPPASNNAGGNRCVGPPGHSLRPRAQHFQHFSGGSLTPSNYQLIRQTPDGTHAAARPPSDGAPPTENPDKTPAAARPPPKGALPMETPDGTLATARPPTDGALLTEAPFGTLAASLAPSDPCRALVWSLSDHCRDLAGSLTYLLHFFARAFRIGRSPTNLRLTGRNRGPSLRVSTKICIFAKIKHANRSGLRPEPPFFFLM